MKPAFCSLCAIAVLTLAYVATTSSLAQTSSATPEPFVTQLTSSPAGFRSFGGDMSANGRFVVFESTGDVATNKVPTRNPDGSINPNARNNEDGNREIFVADYAQRRIFQITNTKNVPNPSPSPSPSPSPTPTPSPTATPSPTPSPVPTPPDLTQVKIEIVNTRPMISLAPIPNESNERFYVIVFSSNAPHPANFNGDETNTNLATDGNTEIWLYNLPAVNETGLDLASGADIPPQDLTGGTERFKRITNTTASRPPTPGGPPPPGSTLPIAPFFADDNREATINDAGTVLAFISTRNLPAAPGNADGNPELYRATNLTAETPPITQLTATQEITQGDGSVFQSNPSISSDGLVIAFLSSATNIGSNNNDNNGRGNAEVFLASLRPNQPPLRQVTLTRGDSPAVNFLSPGRRLSRDGELIAFESRAADPKANSTTNEAFHALFIYTIAADTFVQVGPRAAAAGGLGDFIRFPTFTDYNASLQPSTLLFTSGLNFRTDGTFPPQDQDSTGLNPNRRAQVFATQVPATSSNTFTRLTKNPLTVTFPGLRVLVGDTRQRFAFSQSDEGTLGGGNAFPDNSTELFYVLSPPVSSESGTALSFFTGASNIPLPEASPSSSPTPSPTPSPSPGTITGLAPGEMGIIRTTVEFVPSDQGPAPGSETTRSPALPIELNGVSVSINGAAAGLRFVGKTSKEIQFVVPIGLTPGVATVVVNSRSTGTQFRGFLQIVISQPDIFTTGSNRALICNITDPAVAGCVLEPFSVTTNGSPTVLQINLTGVRGVTTAEVRVSIGGTDVPATDILRVTSHADFPGLDFIDFRLPASFAGADDAPVIVTVTKGGGTFTSRPAASAPLIDILP